MHRSAFSWAILSLWAPSGRACLTQRAAVASGDWSYDAPTHWADAPGSGQCRNGTNQSPIALAESQLSRTAHLPRFHYSGAWTGELRNDGHGPVFQLDARDGDRTTLPRLAFDNQTLYLSSWHTHTPAEHTVGGDRSAGELHMVHVDAAGRPRAVVAFRLDPSPTRRDAHSDFFAHPTLLLPPPPTGPAPRLRLDAFRPAAALADVADFRPYWTYRGSLTTPPCDQGIRWFLAARPLVLGDHQLQALLTASRFSARPTQRLWLHDVGK